ncbi:MAG TPA: PhzF family phenazine biosynthesis protein [Longimicrobiaceae bacterium]|nr:PhzF family phenazine biosynthesis protein [Longimicrobiaceae bacterium]
MPLQIIQVDAFTSRPFTGNPAAVCLLDEPPPDWWLHDVAREMNLSETAFLLAREDGYDLRWFTPAVEVDLCGHATLAAAHVLWEDGHLPASAEACFHTRSGVLTATKDEDWIELDFPAQPAEPVEEPEGLARALGVQPLSVHRSRSDLLVEISDEKALRTLHPNFGELGLIDARGVIVTSPAISDRFDFASRFFAPRSGILEDPVTGSAHCTLGPFWGERLGATTMLGYQVSARGGTVRVRLDGDRVRLGGQAVTVLRGTLLV